VPDIFVKLDFPDRFSENPQKSNVMKILPFAGELFHVEKQRDGWTDTTMCMVAFRNFFLKLLTMNASLPSLLKLLKA
jgi:hypothetical protein